MRHWRVLLAAMVSLAHVQAPAQPPAPAKATPQFPVLELKNVVRQGLAASNELKKAEAAYGTSRALTEVTERRLFPTVNAVGTSAFKKDPDRLTAFSSGSSGTDSDELYDAYLQLSQPIYTGGALVNGIGKLKLSEEIQRQRLIEARQVVVESLVEAYYNLAQSERLLEAAGEHREVLKTYFDIVSRYEQIGRSRRMDRLLAAVNLSTVDAEKVKLEVGRSEASDAIKRLLGQSLGGTPLGGELKIVVAPAEPLSLEKAFEATLENNPEIKVAELERQRQEFDNGLDFVEDMPKLSLEGTWGYKASDRPEWFESGSQYYSIGLKLVVPIFSGLSSVTKRRAHGDLLRGADQNVIIVRENLRQKLQASLIALGSEYTRLNAAQAANKQGREALQLATNAYRQATASNQDVFNAQRTRYDSEKLLIESQFSYLRTLLEVRRLMGVDLEKVYGQ
jgi:outer membrane protein TolC